jgi:hypothetical protein
MNYDVTTQLSSHEGLCTAGASKREEVGDRCVGSLNCNFPIWTQSLIQYIPPISVRTLLSYLPTYQPRYATL